MFRQNKRSKALRSLARGLRLASLRAPAGKSVELQKFRTLVLASSVLAFVSLRQMIGPNYDLLDVWARASFLEGWLKGNGIRLPLGGFARRGDWNSLRNGFEVIRQSGQSDTIHENWLSLKNQNFYKEALEDAHAVASRAKLGPDEAQDVLQDFSTYSNDEGTSVNGFTEVGLASKSVDLSSKGSLKTMGSKVGAKLLGNMRNVLSKIHRQHKLLSEPKGVNQTGGRGRGHFQTQNVADLTDVLMEQMFYPPGRQPVGAANAIIRKIWKAWDSELSETRLAILNEKRRDPRVADTSVARAVSLQLGEEVTRRQVERAKEDWRDIALRTVEKNRPLVDALEDEINMHISLGLGTHKSWMPLMSNPTKKHTELDRALAAPKLQEKRASERLLRILQRSASRKLRRKS